MTQIIIIRGNYGSGKSTLATRVREEMQEKTMFLQQDVLRRDILKVEDKAGNPVIGLIDVLVKHGLNQGYSIVLEGIFSEIKYGDILRSFLPLFDKSHIYHLDIPFEETLKRHNLRSKNNDFGEAEMKEWWLDRDYLGVSNEQIFDETFTEDQLVSHIMKDVLS